MDWTAILRRAGIPEPPGRQEAIAAAQQRKAQRQAAAIKPKPSAPGRGG